MQKVKIGSLVLLVLFFSDISSAQGQDPKPIPLATYLKILITNSSLICTQVPAVRNCYQIELEKCKVDMVIAADKCRQSLLKVAKPNSMINKNSAKSIGEQFGKCTIREFNSTHKGLLKKTDLNCLKYFNN
jgi:hypothetical protein